MMSKVIFIIALWSFASGNVINGPNSVQQDFNHEPHYSFGYKIEDPSTGDSKSQYEIRNGDVVQGSYSLKDPDGTRRTVDYRADAKSGFNAVVKKSPEILATPLVAPAVVSITPINDIKDQNKIDHKLHQNVGPLTANHVHEEFSTVFHYSSPPFVYSTPVANQIAYPLPYGFFSPVIIHYPQYKTLYKA